MAALITELIDKVDNVELIRDQLGAILVLEEANQRTLAAAAEKDPRLWALRVFVERSNPWAEYQDAPDDELDASPIVNITFETSTAPESGGNIAGRQQMIGTFNLDCYGYGVAREDGDGHIAGDHQAAIVSARATRLVRNILMSAQYSYLGLRGIVGKRWPQAITEFQPSLDGRAIQNVMATRIELQVTFNEFSPQFTDFENLGLVSVTVKRQETGEVYLKANYTGEE